MALTVNRPTRWPTLRHLQAAVPVYVAGFGRFGASEELLRVLLVNGWDRRDAVSTLAVVMGAYEDAVAS